MTDTNRMTDQDRKNGSYNRPAGRFEQDQQRGYDQNDYYSSRDDDRDESIDDRGRAPRRSPGHSDRFGSGSSFDDHDEFTRRGVGYGQRSGQFGGGRSGREEATDPEYSPNRADRYRRFGSQGQIDWNERLWRSARGQQGGGYEDRGQYRLGGYAQRERDFGYGDDQRGSEFWRRDEASRFGRGQYAPDWRESQFGKGPKGYKRSDERIAEEINQCLTDDHRIDASDIEVKVRNGEVSLTGTVSDRRCRREVEDVVESVSGVVDVSNQLKVQRSNEISIERGSSRSAINPASKSSSSSKSGGSDVA